MLRMPVRASDMILDWAAKDGYSTAETGWVRARDRRFYFQITAVKDDHQHIARARDREQAAIHLGMLLGYEIDE